MQQHPYPLGRLAARISDADHRQHGGRVDTEAFRRQAAGAMLGEAVNLYEAAIDMNVDRAESAAAHLVVEALRLAELVNAIIPFGLDFDLIVDGILAPPAVTETDATKSSPAFATGGPRAAGIDAGRERGREAVVRFPGATREAGRPAASGTAENLLAAAECRCPGCRPAGTIAGEEADTETEPEFAPPAAEPEAVATLRRVDPFWRPATDGPPAEARRTAARLERLGLIEFSRPGDPVDGVRMLRRTQAGDRFLAQFDALAARSAAAGGEHREPGPC